MSKQSNVVSLSLPKDESTSEKITAYVAERNPEELVCFGIDEEGTPFMVHSPHKTVPKLIIYLDTMKQMLMDEVIAADVSGIVYKEEQDQ
jgi:hypothetical protein